jgi:hypothetical protein
VDQYETKFKNKLPEYVAIEMAATEKRTAPRTDVIT